MKRHTKKHRQSHVDNFLMRNIKRTYAGSKETVVKHGATGVIALLISSVIPMLQAWHSDKQHADEISSIRQEASTDTQDAEHRCTQLVKDLDDRTDRHIIEVENNENDKIKSIWTYIGQRKSDTNNLK